MSTLTDGNNRRVFMKALGMSAVGVALSDYTVWGQLSGGENSVRTIVSEGFGRIVVLRFERGEKLREGIRDKLDELGIKNAVVVSAIGTFEKARFHRITSTGTGGESETITIEAPIEFSSVDGMVINGEPHFHMTFQDLDRAYSVHLEDESVVCFLAEVVLAEIKGEEITGLRG
ncbi:PCC domain-containing protein [Candidatus Latescibacterota bacterium]